MKNLLIFLLSIGCITWSLGQPTADLLVHYSFDNPTNQGMDLSGNGDDATIDRGTLLNRPDSCGVSGKGIYIDGVDDLINFVTLPVDAIQTANFTISFYIKPTGGSFGRRVLFSKRPACDGDHALEMVYNGATRRIEVLMSETNVKAAQLTADVDPNTCWQHVVLVRNGNEQRLYINAVEQDEVVTNSRIDLSNNNALMFSRSPCLNLNVSRYSGILDELRIYARDLRIDEIEDLYVRPDHINQADTIIFLGQSVQITTSKTCANQVFKWTPAADVSNPFIDNPLITPSAPTIYTLEFNHGTCIARDSILINVIDPADVDCAEVFLPNAFTPNGDSRNDTYGVSNPFVFEEFISMEIFDRWGGRMWTTTNERSQWNGLFDGEEVNPGVYLYRVVFKCNGEELVKVGSVTLIR